MNLKVFPGADIYKRSRQECSPQADISSIKDVDALLSQRLAGGIRVRGTALWGRTAASGPPLPALREGPLLLPTGAQAPV